jgi:hypothetical protein
MLENRPSEPVWLRSGAKNNVIKELISARTTNGGKESVCLSMVPKNDDVHMKLRRKRTGSTCLVNRLTTLAALDVPFFFNRIEAR